MKSSVPALRLLQYKPNPDHITGSDHKYRHNAHKVKNDGNFQDPTSYWKATYLITGPNTLLCQHKRSMHPAVTRLRAESGRDVRDVLRKPPYLHRSPPFVTAMFIFCPTRLKSITFDVQYTYFKLSRIKMTF